MYGYNKIEYSRFRHHAWRYLLLFSVLYCFLYCTRLNLSNAGAMMMEGLGWTKSDLGILTGALFWTYGIGQFVNGRLSEIVGPAKFVVASVVLSVAANVLMAFQTSLLSMAVIWGLNGYFQSMGWTPGVAILAKWWPGSKRGFAIGFAHAFSGFGQVAAILSVSLGFALFPALGWRSAFLVSAAFPLLALVVYLVLARTSPSQIGLGEYVECEASRAKSEAEMRTLVAMRGKLYPYRYVLGNGQFRVWIAVVFIAGFVLYGLITWVPVYLVGRFSVDVTTGLFGLISLPVGMGLGTLTLPHLTDRFCPNNRLLAVIFSGLVSAAAIGGFLLLDPRIGWQMVCAHMLLFVAGFCIYATNGTAWAYATDIGGRVFSATSSGVLNFAAYMGAAAQSIVYGMFSERCGWNVVFASQSLCCCMLALIAFASFRRKA